MSEIRIPDNIKSALTQWFMIAREAGYNPGNHGHIGCQIDHSSLLKRLLNGGPVFKRVPPKAYSYPWISLIENGHDTAWENRNHLKHETVRDEKGPWLLIAQSWWKILEEGEDWYIAEQNGWRIKIDIRDQTINDGTWIRDISEEEKMAIVAKQKEEGRVILDITLLNPEEDREQHILTKLN